MPPSHARATHVPSDGTVEPTLQHRRLARRGDGAVVGFVRPRPEERKKKVDAHLEHTWNLLYVSASSAADAASAQLGVAKSQLFGKDAENAAVPPRIAVPADGVCGALGCRSVSDF